MLAFIVNPSSGNGKGRRVWARLEDHMNRSGIAHRVRHTAGSGDAERFARELCKMSDIDTVVAVGGDGTLNETVNGLLDGQYRGRFGMIPAGSGNDFARGYGIPGRPLEALRLILDGSGRTRLIDVMQAGTRWAVNSAGAGLDGQVAYTTNRAAYKDVFNRIGLGKLAYVMALLHVLFTFRPGSVRIRRDGETSVFQEVWLIAFANIPYIGGGMKIAPDAVPDDGRIEVCVVSGISRLALLRIFPKVYAGTHVSHPAVHMLSGRSFRLEGNRAFLLHADGEHAGQTPVSVELHPRKLTIIVPRES